MAEFIQLERLKEGFVGVTSALGEAHYEACLICLDQQNHTSPLQLQVVSGWNDTITITWDGEVTAQMQRAWHSEEVATEWGACGLAFLLISVLTPFTVIRQSRKGTGFDYWLGNKSDLLFEEQARLEVSGIRSATNESIIRTRVRQKWQQVGQEIAIPTYVTVVEFSRPIAYVEYQDES